MTMDNAEYFCTYCNEFLPHMPVAMACHMCGEYKGIIKVSPTQTNEEQE
jgi:hypothetical protein